MNARDARAGTWMLCTMCGHVFKKKSKRHYKCPSCGAHFTKKAPANVAAGAERDERRARRRL